MGRKGSWFSSVKKVFFFSDSKKEQKHHQKYSKLTCFGHHHFDPERESEGAVIAVVPSLPPRKEKATTKVAENEQSKQKFSLVLATAVAAGAAVAAAQAAAAEAARLALSRFPGKTKEESSAIKIQTAFRGYLARRSLRAMRSLARLKTMVKGQSVQRQAATTLQCMQTLSRLQSQVRARKIRMSEENQALQRQLQQKREKELDKLQANVGEKWDYSSQSKEQIEAKLLNRQVAAMRRERALAYASTHQQTWKNSSKSANATFMDPNNPHWGWNWLERWMAARPWEGQTPTYQSNGHPSTKTSERHTMSVGEITKLYTLRDQNHEAKNSPSTPKSNRPRSHNSSPSPLPSKAPSNGNKTKTPTSPKGGSWGGDGESKSLFIKNTENNRRHSIAFSPVRNDESLENSPKSKVLKAKPKVQSASSVVNRNGAPEKAASVSAKKRLSLPGTQAGSRRNSLASKVGIGGSSKSVVATIPEEKVKVRYGGGSR